MNFRASIDSEFILILNLRESETSGHKCSTKLSLEPIFLSHWVKLFLVLIQLNTKLGVHRILVDKNWQVEAKAKLSTSNVCLHRKKSQMTRYQDKTQWQEATRVLKYFLPSRNLTTKKILILSAAIYFYVICKICLISLSNFFTI